MAESQAECSIADQVLRAWRPFLMIRGPVSQLRYNNKQGNTPRRRPSGKPSQANGFGAVGLSLSQSPRAVTYLGMLPTQP